MIVINKKKIIKIEIQIDYRFINKLPVTKFDQTDSTQN